MRYLVYLYVLLRSYMLLNRNSNENVFYVCSTNDLLTINLSIVIEISLLHLTYGRD